MNQTEETILRRFRNLLTKRLRLGGLILFGSRARGDAEPLSDLDVIVILEGMVSDADRDYVSECAWEAGFDSGIVVVPVVFSRQEWETGPESRSLLVQAVKAEGVPV